MGNQGLAWQLKPDQLRNKTADIPNYLEDDSDEEEEAEDENENEQQEFEDGPIKQQIDQK